MDILYPDDVLHNKDYNQPIKSIEVSGMFVLLVLRYHSVVVVFIHESCNQSYFTAS